MSTLTCDRCGSTEFTDDVGRRVCVYCQSTIKDIEPVSKNTNIQIHSDIQDLLQKCKDDPANRDRYVRMILNIDPSNKEVQKFLEPSQQSRKARKRNKSGASELGGTKSGPNPNAGVTVMDSGASLNGGGSGKSWTVALILSLLLGWLGVDRFYLGQIGLGIAKLLTAGGFMVWWLIDVVLIGLKRARDSEGRLLR